MTDRLIEKNLFELYEAISINSGIPIVDLGKFGYVQEKENVWPNMIFLRSESWAVENSDIENLNIELVDYPNARLLILNYKLLTGDLLNVLKLGRFAPIAQWTNMAMPSTGIAWQELNSSNDHNIRVTNVQNEQGLEEWVRIVGDALFNGRNLDTECFRRGVSKGIFELILAYYNGVPASTAMLYKGENAGVYMVATDSKFRRLGIARKVMQFGISKLSGANYKEIVLHSTREGLDFYKSLGFEELGKMILLYKS